MVPVTSSSQSVVMVCIDYSNSRAIGTSPVFTDRTLRTFRLIAELKLHEGTCAKCNR